MLTAIAPAKLNLTLHITGKRADGYHLLDSLVVFTTFGDELRISQADALSLVVEGPFADNVPAGEDNLILRAACALQSYAGTDQGARIRLIKKLPVGAGLGGGSSDAATAVRLLCSLWGVMLPASRAVELLLPLGADLPVCWSGKPAMMAGIGEEVTPLDVALPACPVLLIKPQPSLDTARVYGAYLHEERPVPPFALDLTSAESFIESLEGTRNDLQRAAIICCAEIAQVLLEMQTQYGCGLARLSGSGSACFGLFDDADACARAAYGLKQTHPEWWVEVTELQS
jgi:4-diphosphocytidyl-2-C-methyl-D-erythritol kinase